MGWFTQKYSPNIKILYKEPERFSPEEARQRRVFAELGRQRKELEAREARLSQANQFHLNKLKEFESKFQGALEARRRNVKEREAAFRADKSEGNFRRLKTSRSVLVQLLSRRQELQQRATMEARARATAQMMQASAADRRFYNPSGSLANPRTVFGTDAWTFVNPVSRRYFTNPLLAVPCVQRLVRREVMFAKKKAGIGHKVRHRFNALSFIGC